ncbi:MAG TPA: protein kinase, partial [Trichormus sp.]
MNQPEKPLKQESLTTSSSASSTRVCSSCGLAWEMTTTTCPRDGTALTTPIETDPAFRNYEYIETCGEGGMGVVYKARQVILNKVIAIKMLHPRLLSAEAILRFQREGASASMLEHPNIIKVLDLGVCAAGPYMILEFLQGQTLSQLLSAHGPLSTERFLHIFIQVCDALEHAHSRGILHRDLKPSNIMLTRNFKNEEEIRIMDFGIAKFIGESSQESFVSKLTRTGEAIGSPAYMSPEQAQNNNLDVRSDLYSIGCVMYEALTGSPPFVKANALDTLMAHLSEQPLSMAQAVLNARKFDEGLETIVARLLQKDPDLRFQTMHELKQQLIAIRDGQGLGQFVYDQNASEKPQKRFLAIAAWALPTVALCCVLLFMVKALNPFKHEKSTPQPNVVAALGDPSSQFNTHRAMTDPIAVKVDNKETVFSIGAEGLTTDDDLMPLQRSQVAVKISLRKAAITGEGLKYIKNIPTLKILNLTGTAVDTLKHLQNMQSLEELDLDQTRINDEQLEPISNLHLQRLDLSYTNVSALDALKEMQSLQTVRLNYASHLNREGMEVLGQLNNLAHLYLNHTNITDKDLLLLASLPNIQEIQVYGCKNLTG